MNFQDLNEFEKRLDILIGMKLDMEQYLIKLNEEILKTEEIIKDSTGRINEVKHIIDNIKEKTNKELRIDKLM